ncbi:MAG TPA: hypothetical protein VL333_13015 [Candidatus Saccharimonadales bacterium]|jgi:hypothetical protein|nr:hypothetical protein [Candidatus Saccharimonadales bacterium]
MKRLLQSRLAGFLAVALVMGVAMLVGAPAAHASPLLMGVTTDTTALDNLMKIIYSDPLIVDIVNDSELMDMFKTDFNVKTDETTGGKYIETAHYIRLAGAAGARAENDYIPVPQNPKAFNGRIFLKKIMGVVEMTGDTMDRVVGDEGSFINFMERALPDTKERVVNEMDRMYIGFGAGIKARVKAGWVAGGRVTTALTIDRALGVTGYEDAWLQFQEGETIVFSSTAAGTALRNPGSTQAALVEDIDESANTLSLTLDAALTAAIADDDYIFSGDQAGTASQNSGVDRELAGLLAAVDDGGILPVYNNVTRAGNRSFNSRIIDASGAPYNGELTEELLIVADAVTISSAAAKIDALVVSPHASIGYWRDVVGDRMIADARNFTGGKGKMAVQLGDRIIPFRSARKLPPQIAFGLTTSTFRRFTLNTWEWINRQGSIWNLVTDNVGRKDAYFAFGKLYEQLACLVPRRNFRIEGLNRQFDY